MQDRPPIPELIDALAGNQDAINRELARNDVRFGVYHDRLFPYDSIQRIVPSAEHDRRELPALRPLDRTSC